MLSNQKPASLSESPQETHSEVQMKKMIPRQTPNKVSDENSKENKI